MSRASVPCLALHRIGRTVDGLAVYERARQRLAEVSVSTRHLGCDSCQRPSREATRKIRGPSELLARTGPGCRPLLASACCAPACRPGGGVSVLRYIWTDVVTPAQ